MYRYAHLNEANICVIESEGETPIAKRNVIRVDDVGHVGMRWTGCGWAEVPAVETNAAAGESPT